MKIRMFAVYLLMSAVLAGCAGESSYSGYKYASDDLFVRSNHCAAAELIRYLLPELGDKFGGPNESCIKLGWRGPLALGGYGQSIGFAAHAGKTGFDIRPPSTLVIASLVNLDALERSSTLGRVISEQVSATFTKTGYQMRELKLAHDVFCASRAS